MTIQKKAIEKYFQVALLNVLHKMVLLSLNYVDGALVCDHSNEAMLQVFFSGSTAICSTTNFAFWGMKL